MIKTWQFKELSEEENTSLSNLTNELNISPSLASLLVQREIKSFEEAKNFFRPSFDQLHSPFLMKDMDKAVSRLNAALRAMEKVLILGDYDVDGTTSVALMYSFLRQLQPADKLDYYIPDRKTEGYGISTQSIDYAKKNGFSLIIALDCGIKAVEEVAYANELNIDFIICDHHTPDETLPQAVAVLDPKRLDCTYPYEHLSGCGVGFKLAHAFAIDNQINFDEALSPLLDLLAVSIASDIVPINLENRVLAHFGLKQISEKARPGLSALKKLSRFNNPNAITTSDIVYKIGPRLNASGRLKSGNDSVSLLIETDPDKAKKKAALIDKTNDERREFDQKITQSAQTLIESSPELLQKKTIVLYNKSWHKGVIGIVASRLSETFHKPTVIFTFSNGKATGSARSIRGFNLYEAVESCSQYLDSFGGHKYAAGLTLSLDKIEEFANDFECYVAKHISPELEVPKVDIDQVLTPEEITNPKFLRILKQFSPYGPKAPKPTFASLKLIDAGSYLVGKHSNHIKVKLIDPLSQTKIEGIAFSQSEYFHLLKSKQMVDICYTLEESCYQNKVDFKIQIKDIRLSER